MARWLNLRIAQQQGIAANINYHQPGEWVWSLAGSVLGDGHGRDPYTGEALGWRLFAILPRMLGQPAFRGLRSYLDEDHSGIKRWQLAQRIAGCFDRYQAHRPQMIRDWSAGEEHRWQARLWREAVESAGQAHRVELIDRLVVCLKDASLELDLPARISMFAISSALPA
jgi:exodeoxyribonuclease V gamma subunit